jgi:uncharacterized membrane protein YdjX (TVP38/TMEM64 family)
MKSKFILLATLALIAFGFLLASPDLVKEVLQVKSMVLDYCRAHPAAIFVALVILPGLGFPVSALLVLAGAVWGSNWQSCLIGIGAMALNMSWTYYLAAGPARALITRLLGDRWDRWKSVSQSDLLRITVLLRVTPGIPLFAQNYILGLLAAPFAHYLLVSIPLNSIYVVGFILTGGAIFQGKVGMAITGIFVLAAAALLVHLIRSKLAAAQPQDS